MNIQFQTCGLILDVILIYFFLRHETVGLFSERIFLPSIRTSPYAGSKPAMTRRSVVLPHPFGPSRQTQLPSWIPREISLMTSLLSSGLAA